MASKKRKSITDDVESVTEGPQKKISKTAVEFLEITVEQASVALEKLKNGYVPPGPGEKNYQSTALGWGPAIRNAAGCVLVQKKPSHVGFF